MPDDLSMCRCQISHKIVSCKPHSSNPMRQISKGLRLVKLNKMPKVMCMLSDHTKKEPGCLVAQHHSQPWFRLCAALPYLN